VIPNRPGPAGRLCRIGPAKHSQTSCATSRRLRAPAHVNLHVESDTLHVSEVTDELEACTPRPPSAHGLRGNARGAQRAALGVELTAGPAGARPGFGSTAAGFSASAGRSDCDNQRPSPPRRRQPIVGSVLSLALLFR